MTTGPLEIVEGTGDGAPAPVPLHGASSRRDGVDPGSRLRESLDEIVQALGRIREPGTPTPTRGQDTELLLRRARTLADELREVVGQLLGEPADDGGSAADRRRIQLRVPVVAAFERATADTGEALNGRPVSIACPDRLCVQTEPERLHELLCALLRDAARRPGEIHLLVQRQRSELVLTLSGNAAGAASGRDLDRIQGLARALGGHIDVVGHPENEAALRVRLPQQRAQDARPWA